MTTDWIVKYIAIDMLTGYYNSHNETKEIYVIASLGSFSFMALHRVIFPLLLRLARKQFGNNRGVIKAALMEMVKQISHGMY